MFAKSSRSIVLAVLVSAVLVSPVLAAVQKSGTKYCPVNQTPYTRSYSTGLTDSSAPGGSANAEWDNGSTWIVRQVYATHGGGGGYWVVVVYGGSLNDPGTYGACINGTP
jgi:hypothetical protein